MEKDIKELIDHIFDVGDAIELLREKLLDEAADTHFGKTIKRDPWKQFIEGIERLNDGLMLSIFIQSSVVNIGNEEFEIHIPSKLEFFKDWIENGTEQWQPLFHEAYGNTASVTAVFTG